MTGEPDDGRGAGDERPIRALGMAGSLRRASYNRALLRAAAELAPARLDVEVFDLSPVPFYHGDVEKEGDPEPVAALKSAIRSADLVLIVTPEYNQGMPAVTKNAVDWGSRPPKPQAWEGKPVAIMGATPGRLATVSSQRHLRESLGHLAALVMPQPRVMVSGAGSLFEGDPPSLVDEETRARVARFMESAAEWTDRFRPE